MLSEVLFATVLYWLFALLVVYPPSEVTAAGVSVECLLRRWTGMESLTFIHYHIKRSSYTCIVHTLLLPGYVLTLKRVEPTLCDFLDQNLHHGACVATILVSALPTLAMWCLVWRWRSGGGWDRHPITSKLKVYLGDSFGSWKSVAADIDMEFRRIDKFSSGTSSVYKVVVTDSWLIKVTSHTVDLVQLRDAVMSVKESHHTHPTTATTQAPQLLTIRVLPVREDIKPFTIKLNSVEFGELERKVVNPVLNVSRVVIKQTLSDYFLETFTQTVSLNPTSTPPRDRQQCFGCQQTLANVSLKRRCGGGGGGDGCEECNCQPMWCVSCLGKWFASRQDQQDPESWLGSRAPCPTCRSTFCLLDVSLLA